MSADRQRRVLLAAAATALSGCALPGGPGGREAPAAAVRVGDRWRYQVIERYRDRLVETPIVEVVEAGPEIVLRVSGRGGSPAVEERYSAPWSVLQESVYGLTMRFGEPMPLVPLPAAPGAGSTRVTTYTVPGETPARRWSQQLRVEGWEPVTVPAGRFDSLRITRVIAFDHPDAGRRASVLTDRLWYAPEVRHWVRREWRGEYVSAGAGAGRDTAAQGTSGIEDWLEWRLAAFLPAPVSS